MTDPTDIRWLDQLHDLHVHNQILRDKKHYAEKLNAAKNEIAVEEQAARQRLDAMVSATREGKARAGLAPDGELVFEAIEEREVEPPKTPSESQISEMVEDAEALAANERIFEERTGIEGAMNYEPKE